MQPLGVGLPIRLADGRACIDLAGHNLSTNTDPECLYHLQGRVRADTWRAVVPFAYCELRTAKSDAEFYLGALSSCVRVINKSTGQIEYTATRVYRADA